MTNQEARASVLEYSERVRANAHEYRADTELRRTLRAIDHAEVLALAIVGTAHDAGFRPALMHNLAAEDFTGQVYFTFSSVVVDVVARGFED